MKYSDFRNEVCVALYAYTNGASDFVGFGLLVDRYQLKCRAGWLLEVMNDLESEGLIRAPKNATNDEMAGGWMTGKGLTYVENITSAGPYNEKLIMWQLTDQLQSEEHAGQASADSPKVMSIDSTTWTGLPKEGLLSDTGSHQLLSALSIVDDALEKADASNEQKSQARAYIIAIRALAEAPSPPADLIWMLVSRANNIAGITSLFVSIASLFISVTH